jgi:uncharacterized protein YqjF (DUF2071 family)
MVRQEWRFVTFLHWPVPTGELRLLVPETLEIDTIHGSGWVSVTPFSTTCEPLGVVPLPGPGRFPETNVRTYVRGPDGRDGLYFLSLDVANHANAVLGRCLGLPYQLSDMQIDVDGSVRYGGHRRDSSDQSAYDITVEPEGSCRADSLDVFLTGRWSAYVSRGRHLLRCDVDHEPWPLQRARLSHCRQGLLSAAGVTAGDEPSLVHFAPGVSAHLGTPVPLRSGTAP